MNLLYRSHSGERSKHSSSSRGSEICNWIHRVLHNAGREKSDACHEASDSISFYRSDKYRKKKRRHKNRG